MITGEGCLDARSADGKAPAAVARRAMRHGLPFAGHKDNHAGLMNKTQMQEFRQQQGVNQGEEWEKFAGMRRPREEVESFLSRVPVKADALARCRDELRC